MDGHVVCVMGKDGRESLGKKVTLACIMFQQKFEAYTSKSMYTDAILAEGF